ncbi:glycosyltransferase family 2 protein [Prochlorothrix hollandica]|uniref:glycosyltransferase family 2 protein n=1 Tax=Prochlorothrix hollandica TaxID=1223 RepID=UPI003341F1CF
MPCIFIVVLNWNGLENTLGCLQSLAQLRSQNHHIIVVDNHSDLNPKAAIAAQFPQVEVLENQENLGFAGGCNRGIQLALDRGADWVLLLNNDTQVDPQLLHAFAQGIADHPQGGAFGAKIYQAQRPDLLEFCGGDYVAKSARFTNRGYHQRDQGQWDQPQQSDYLTGCTLLLKREVLEQVGLLHEPYFLLWEDLDLGWRIRRSGWQLWVIPQAQVWHQGSASFKGGRWAAHYWYFDARNQLLWLERNVGWRSVLWQSCRRTGKHGWNYLRAKTAGDRQAQKAALVGIWHYFRRRFGNCPPWVMGTD